MKKIAQEELDKILRLHKLFLDGKGCGERADLSSANLIKANMEYATITLTKENIKVLKQL